MSVHHVYTQCLWGPEEGGLMPWNRCPGTSYWWFWVAMLMPGIELESSTRAASTLEHWAIYPPPWNILKDILSHHGHLESQCSVLCYVRKCSYGTIFVFLQHCTKQRTWQKLVIQYNYWIMCIWKNKNLSSTLSSTVSLSLSLVSYFWGCNYWHVK